MIGEAHEDLAHYRGNQRFPDPDPKYFESPGVWEEIEQVYAEYFERYPLDHARRSRFVALAAAAQRWDVADKHLKLLGTNVAVTEFGGREAYRKAIEQISAEMPE